MIKQINSAKTEKGRRVLTTPCTPITVLTDEHKKLIQDMRDTATAYPYCIGLCANQIWEDDTMPAPAIIIVPGQTSWIVCINPMIDRKWKKELKKPEGCMSLPGFSKEKSRKRHLLISHYDEDMEYCANIQLFDIAARIFQHEMDHIEGSLLSDG